MPLPYVLPQVQVFQEFNEVSQSITEPLGAWIVGPNAQLFRYAEANEKLQIALGQYNPNLSVSYNWPNQPVASVVDQTYVELFIDNAQLLYFQDLISGGDTVTCVAGTINQIKSTNYCFATNAGEVRSACFLDRDVQPGDIVWIRGSSDGSQDTLCTYVRALIAQVIPATVGAGTPDVANAEMQSLSVTIAQVAGPQNELELVVDTTDYNALIDGHVNDTYTITVTGASVGGNLSTALLQITTASGYEYLTNVVPAILDETVAIGTRGLKIGFEHLRSSHLVSPGIDLIDLLVGQVFTVVIQEAVVPPTATSGGNYAGAIDNTYIVTVTSGGFFADAQVTRRPRVSIRTSYGTDSVSNLIVNEAVTFPLGTSGANLTFTGATGLVKGDRFYVAVNAAAPGDTNTIVLGHNLSSILQAAPALDLRLYIQTNIQVPAYVTQPVPGFNWTTSPQQFTVNANLYAFTPSWTSGGVVQPLPVMSGSMYVQYRAWLATLVNDVSAINSISQIASIPGQLDPDNPLAWAVSKALANSNGVNVNYTAVSDPTSNAAWLFAMALGSQNSGLYSIVPLTQNQAILDLFVAYVNDQSSPTVGNWCKLFASLTANAETVLESAATSTDGNPVLGTVAAAPGVSPTQYLLVAITSGNASLLAAGVQAGDLFRTGFVTDPTGNTTYHEFVVASVVNEEALLLVSGPLAAISVPQKIEIWHPNSTTQLDTQIGMAAGTYGNRRVCAVWPDTVGAAGVTFPGYHLCAALAGLASGVVPQQHLTNVEIAGFDDLSRTTKLFSTADLDTIASYGVWIVTQDSNGNVITRDALTTDRSSLQSQVEMVVRNVDSISFLMMQTLQKYIGNSNVVQSNLDLMQIDLISAISFLVSNGFTARLGGQLIDATIVTLRQSVTQLDQVVITINLTIPYPVDVITLNLVA